MLIRERYRWAAFAVGMAVLFHLQIGVIATLMIAPFYAVKLKSFGIREIGRLALCYLIPASAAVIHLIEMMRRGLLRPASQTWSLPYYIDFRHPHHFELMSAAHGSETNESDRRRCGLTLRYCAAEVRAYQGWNSKGVVVGGVDADGHWANAPRPA